MQFNPYQVVAPEPLVSVGQMQQGISQQAQNIMGLRDRLQDTARAANASKIQRMLAQEPNLDWTNPTAVRQTLGGLMDFTTDTSRANIMDRLAGARQKRMDDSSLQTADMERRNVGSQIRERNTLLGPRRENLIRRNEGVSLDNLGKYNQNKLFDATFDNVVQGSGLDNILKQAQIQKALTPTVKEPKKGPIQKAAEEKTASTIKDIGYSKWTDQILDKIEAGLNQGNIFEREISSQDRPLLKGAINNLIQTDTKISKLLALGQMDAAAEAIKQALKEKGYQIDVGGGSPELLRPSTWFGGTTRIKRR